ncbi:MAG: tRNA (N6-threonylcarbamoyladenosine(37)-N6)-methyltransferase TrmO [Lentisphaeria bacterium]|nr:tRNA (N6-threonylcarbamoyladenosine(37)-N6)-methyltransferase TrmO [Lentisphaeria bacterium]
MTTEPTQLTLSPIGFYHGPERYPYDVPRQGVLAPEKAGVIELLDTPSMRLALTELGGFSHLWVIFWFHRNTTWRPLVCPPRHREQKVGVFASRSPYRPNPLGLSCVRLTAIDGHCLHIAGHDLLDGTPVLDLKPYLPYADARPEATAGWTAADQERQYDVILTDAAETRLAWLEAHGVSCLRDFIRDRLEAEPLNPRRHRLENRTAGGATLAYRTWRADFTCNAKQRQVWVTAIRSGYSETDLNQPNDRYGDKNLHRCFAQLT